MKKRFILLFISLFISISIYSKESKQSFEMLNGQFVIKEWNGQSFIQKSFADFTEGSTLELFVVPTAEYSRLQFFDLNWQPFLFANVTCSPSPIYVSQINREGNNVSKVAFNYNADSPETYVIEIVLTQNDVDFLKENGLILTGCNCNVNFMTANVLSSKSSSGKKTSSEKNSGKHSKSVKEIQKRDSQKYKMPMIFVTTDDGSDVTGKTAYKSKIDVLNCDKEYQLSVPGKFRIRGNSSASDTYSKDCKPYKISFDNPQSMLGMNKNQKFKNWVLLKTRWIMGCDYLGFNLAHELYKFTKSGFDYYASDTRFVHVYVNGDDKGIYLLCEQNQVEDGRVSVNKNTEKNKDVKTGYMLELDNYAWEDTHGDWQKNYHQITSGKWKGGSVWKGIEEYHVSLDYKHNGVQVNLKDVNGYEAPLGNKIVKFDGFYVEYGNDDFTLKNKIYSDDQAAFIAKYLKGVWDISYNAIEKNKFYKFDDNYNLVKAPEFKTAKEACNAVIDLDSLVTEIILEELVRDNDVGAGSLYMAVDFSVAPGSKYEKLTFECPWDFNWAYMPIKNDCDKGKFWTGKKQYFAGGWQSPYLIDGEIKNGKVYERSNYWFILFTKAPWFRKMLRERWNEITPEHLKMFVGETEYNASDAIKEQSYGDMNGPVNFLKDRIDYIEENLWK